MEKVYKPVIGITARQKLRGPEDGLTTLGNKIHFAVVGHSWAVEQCGGIPLVIPLLKENSMEEEYLNLIDGLIITEGEDMSPATYQRETLPECSKDLDLAKDSFELKITKLAIERNMPLLGICRGIHVFNVLRNGTLCQDLPTYFTGKRDNKILHRGEGDLRYKTFHDVHLLEGSLVEKCYGSTKISVNSIHHQGIERLGENLNATAWSEDGLIEAVEIPECGFALALQWHPERVWDEVPVHLNVFRHFIEAAQKYRTKQKYSISCN